jgi:hypothetical protein
LKKFFPFALVLLFIVACDFFQIDKSLPSVVTIAPENIFSLTCTSGGTIHSSGGDTISAQGVCWSTNPNPSRQNTNTLADSISSTYFCKISGLRPLTTYYIRAFATNIYGTSYGQEYSITTLRNSLLGTWIYSYGEYGNWNKFIFKNDLSYEFHYTNVMQAMPSGSYTFDENIIVLSTLLKGVFTFRYTLSGDSLILSNNMIYTKQ